MVVVITDGLKGKNNDIFQITKPLLFKFLLLPKPFYSEEYYARSCHTNLYNQSNIMQTISCRSIPIYVCTFVFRWLLLNPESKNINEPSNCKIKSKKEVIESKKSKLTLLLNEPQRIACN
jgi:hypothetical protein